MRQIGILILGCMIFFSCAGKPPENIGLHNKQLTDCPTSPNCVSSQAEDIDHAIAPLEYKGEKKMAIIKLKKAIASLKGMTLVTQSRNYLHVECKSVFMGFVDDLEFYFSDDPPGEKIIQVRSASRLGYSDFGVNRKRVEQLRQLFSAE
jgi:uncharacterized protein (DUF1499 family)